PASSACSSTRSAAWFPPVRPCPPPRRRRWCGARCASGTRWSWSSTRRPSGRAGMAEGALAPLARVAADLLGADLGPARSADLARAAQAARAADRPGGGPLDDARLARRLRTAAPDDPVRQAFVEALTISETHLFRIRGQFDALAERVLPSLVVARRRTRRLRLWSAGCSTGEEAWTLAILLDRLLAPGALRPAEPGHRRLPVVRERDRRARRRPVPPRPRLLQSRGPGPDGRPAGPLSGPGRLAGGGAGRAVGGRVPRSRGPPLPGRHPPPASRSGGGAMGVARPGAADRRGAEGAGRSGDAAPGPDAGDRGGRDGPAGRRPPGRGPGGRRSGGGARRPAPRRRRAGRRPAAGAGPGAAGAPPPRGRR